jgi:hypothetical protein
MSRGGYFAIRPAVVLQADGWADLSCSALGSWIRLRASAELTELPVSDRTAERLGVTADDMETLRAAGLLEETPAGILAVGMPGPAKNPSDDPERVRARVAAHRAKVAAAKGERKTLHPKKETTPVHSIPFQSNEVTTVTALHAPDGVDDEGTENDPQSEGVESEDRVVAVPKVRSQGVSLSPMDALSRAFEDFPENRPKSWRS